jgi:HlyD family secretion protein
LVEGLDLGDVKAGSLTRLKLEAWPFQKHGTLTGQFRTLSEDAFNPEPKKDGEARPHYKARIGLTSTKLRDVPPTFRLIPGMSVTAEIKCRRTHHTVIFPLPAAARAR